MSAMQIKTVPRSRALPPLKQSEARQRNFLSPRGLRTAGIPPFVGKIDYSELQNRGLRNSVGE